MNTNLLITSAGKRVSLVNIFQRELKERCPSAKVYTTDLNPAMAPAGHVSDRCFSVPRVTAENYLDELLSICSDNQISLIIPTIDTELILLAEHKQQLLNEGIIALVPDAPFVAACRDKRNTAELFRSLRIRIPEPRDLNHPQYPIFAKPYDGSLSKDLHILRSDADITPAVTENPKLIFMEYIDKTQYKEFTVDMYYGRDHRVKSIVPRERVEIRAGEINKGFTRKNELVPYLRERMEHLPGVVGCICLQLFYRESDHDVVGIEINPRFGGGYPLSYYAGANFPGMIVEEYLQGLTPDYSEHWEDNTLMLRYDAEVIIHEQQDRHHL